MSDKKGIYYGWIIVAASMLLTGFVVGIAGNCFSLFVVPVCEELGCGRGAMGVNQTILSVGGLLVSLFSVKILRRFKLLNLMKLASITLCLVYALYAVLHSIWAFYIVSFIVSVCVGLLGWMPLSLILNNWFEKKRGFAVGLAFMGSGLGGMLFNLLGGMMIDQLGWRAAFALFALIIGTCVIPCVFFVLKVRPEDKGLKPYGAGEAAVEATRATVDDARARDPRGPYLYILFVCIVVATPSMNALATTLAAYMADSGHSVTAAANACAAHMGALALGKISLGMLYDRLGATRASALALLSSCLGMLLAASGTGNLQLYAAAVLAGLGSAFGSVAYPILSRSIFGTRDFARATGLMLSGSYFGSILSPLMNGVARDLMGSYAPCYVLFGVMTLVAGLAILLIIPRNKRPAAKPATA